MLLCNENEHFYVVK